MTNASKYQIYHLIDSSGGSDYFWSLARYQNRERFQLIIGSVQSPGHLQKTLRSMDISTYSLHTNSRRKYFGALSRLVRQLRRSRPALLHAHCFDPTLLGLLAARMARIPFIFTRHHSDHHIRPGKVWHTRVDSWCARHADHVIAVSQATRDIMIEIEGVPASQITVVYNGMEPLREPDVAEVVALRRELALDERPICLTIARLHQEKGHDHLLEALPAIQSATGPLQILWAGEGDYRVHLETEISKRGLQNTVRLLGQRQDIPHLIALSDLVVQPSLAESFGYALLEGMSLGKPIVATTTGGIPEVVTHGETGLLVPTSDSAALAQAVTQLLTDPQRAAAMGRAGQERSQQFTFERMMRGYEEIYERICSHSIA